MADDKLFAIDIDGVACDHATAICRYVEEVHGVECEAEDVVTWDHDFGPITFMEAVDELYPDRSFILDMPVTRGFSSFFESLRERLSVTFASAREAYCHKATTDWIRRNFGDVPIHFTKDKSASQAAYLVEDNAKEALGFAKGNGVAFLLRKPWNDNIETRGLLAECPHGFFVSSFSEILATMDCDTSTGDLPWR